MPEPEIISLVLDEDCPECGYPETYAEVYSDFPPSGVEAFGCRKCGWRHGWSES